MALSRREQAEYDRLRQKARAKTARDRGGSRRRVREDDDDDDGLFVLTGRHADNFVNKLFGRGRDVEDDDDEDDDEDEDEGEEDDEDDDDDVDEDPQPPAGNRFFRRRG